MPLSLGSTSWIPSSSGTIRNNDLTAADDGVFGAGSDRAPRGNGWSYVQLKNPVGSGITVLIDYIQANSTCDVELKRYDSDLSTDIGNGLDLNGNATSSSAHLRTGDMDAPGYGTSIATFGGSLTDTSWGMLNSYPIEILEGDGIMVAGVDINNAVFAYYTWREI